MRIQEFSSKGREERRSGLRRRKEMGEEAEVQREGDGFMRESHARTPRTAAAAGGAMIMRIGSGVVGHGGRGMAIRPQYSAVRI